MSVLNIGVFITSDLVFPPELNFHHFLVQVKKNIDFKNTK